MEHVLGARSVSEQRTKERKKETETNVTMCLASLYDYNIDRFVK